MATTLSPLARLWWLMPAPDPPVVTGGYVLSPLSRLFCTSSTYQSNFTYPFSDTVGHYLVGNAHPTTLLQPDSVDNSRWLVADKR